MTGQWRYYLGNLGKICLKTWDKNANKLICIQYLDSQFLLTHFFLSLWTNNVTNVPKVMKLMSSPTCHFRFSIFFLETLKFEWQCSHYLELNRPVLNNQITFHCSFRNSEKDFAVFLVYLTKNLTHFVWFLTSMTKLFTSLRLATLDHGSIPIP